MNTDTIYALQGSGVVTPTRNQLAMQTALGTAETIITMGADNATNTGAFLPIPAATAIVGVSNPQDPNANAGVLLDNFGGKAASNRGSSRPYYNSGSLDGRGFRVRLQGRLVTSATATVTVKFYQQLLSAGAVLAGANLIASIVNAGVTAQSSNFVAEATAYWDSVGLKVATAEFWGAVAGVFTGRVSGTQAPFSVTTAQWAASILIASVTFSAGATNTISPIEFSMEDI